MQFCGKKVASDSSWEDLVYVLSERQCSCLKNVQNAREEFKGDFGSMHYKFKLYYYTKVNKKLDTKAIKLPGLFN